MDDEEDRRPPLAKAEILDFGPRRAWSRRRRWATALAALGVVLVALAGWLGWRTLQANNPTFTTAELVTLYQEPAPRPGDRLTWDPESSTADDLEPDDDQSVPTQPPGCGILLMDDTAPTADDVITVELRAVDGSDTGDDYTRVGSTYLYPAPEIAEQKLTSVKEALDRCLSFSTGNLRWVTHDIRSERDRRGGATLGYQLSLGDEPEPIRIELTQYGNSVTWTIGALADAAGAPGSGSVNRQLVTRLRALFLDR